MGEIKLPPTDLQLLCSRDSLARNWGGYGNCLLACLTYQCYLTPDGVLYLVQSAPGAAHKTVTPPDTVVRSCSRAGACPCYEV